MWCSKYGEEEKEGRERQNGFEGDVESDETLKSREDAVEIEKEMQQRGR